MRYTSLATVKHRVAVGRPLPFNVLNRDLTLLLAKGQVVDSQDQMQALFVRGMQVDLTELYRGADAIAEAPAALLPTLWVDNMAEVATMLRQSDRPSFRAALDECSAGVTALIARDPDLAIFQVLHQDVNAHLQYGIDHSIHAAIVCRLVADRLGWSADEATRAFKAALTMNLSMLELQGQLATQPTPPSDAQRRDIRLHPVRSREMLINAGVTDVDWLRAVEQHHERPDGRGYPFGMRTPCELATLVQRADIYTAKLSARRDRDALAADRAGREIFMSDPANPITAALVKEFGIYPPGCFVRLASGETGVVVKRGSTVMAPIVATLTDARGQLQPVPVRRDTGDRRHAVVGVLPGRGLRLPVSSQSLAMLAAA